MTGVSSPPIALYVHIPFCAARCPYCDFATAPATSALRGRYLDAIATELRREGAALGRPAVGTIFFGGGTPSLLDPEEIASLGRAISASFDVRAEEITVEANPATLDRARLEAWCALGITRLSLGAQTFSDRGLRALGRTHQASDVAPAVGAARSAGLQVSLDLIFGWPGQTAADLAADLDMAVALGVDHLSAYPLELELEPEDAVANWPGGWEGLARWRSESAARQPGEDAVADLYELAGTRLAAAGYRHYEIANWAKPGRECRHNLVYWRNGSWLGVGAGAHSHLGGVRSHQPAALFAYLGRIDGDLGRIADDGTDPETDTAILALRLDDGLDLAGYADRFGPAARERVAGALHALDRTGLVAWSGDRVALTPRGRFVASAVFVRLLPD
ncbi:MAG TPA: radical SAM family heme chaperone HemW [Candidatus Saccharimonadales bacterium]|nr:radical SAM family heme chaperone HemW [Candidatus Saccharimonadales bacterium]